jgi:hypothetical protein
MDRSTDRSTVNRQVNGQRTTVNGQRTTVNGHRSPVNGQVNGQVTGQWKKIIPIDFVIAALQQINGNPNKKVYA